MNRRHFTRAVNCLRPAILALLTCSTLQPGFGQPLPPQPKKLIITGWDNPTPAQMRKNLSEMEKQPFDGTVIRVSGRDAAGKSYSLDSTFAAGAWQRAWFQQDVTDLQACHSARLTDNFINVGGNPGNVDWFDDAGWRDIVDHWRIAAWVAREGHVKGILFDCEAYVAPYMQFNYATQAGRSSHSFDEYYLKARQRGREVMRAIAEIDPTLTIFCYRMNSVNPTAVGHADARELLATSGYGLYSPFINGWLDAAPPTLTFVDGCEDTYLANSDLDYLRFEDLVKTQALDLVAPEDRAKYRAQVEVGYGCYLDAYLNPLTSPYHMPALPDGVTRADQLGANVATALRLSDQYVWLYGEQHRWWPPVGSKTPAQTWPDVLPGIEEALGYAVHPTEMARRKVADLRAAGTLVNLARNGDFSAGPDAKSVIIDQAPDWKTAGAPAQWATWQDDNSTGTFGWDGTTGAAAPGSARVSKVQNGCFSEVFLVEPGQYYAISALTKRQGGGNSWIRVGWKTPDGKWLSAATVIPQSDGDHGADGRWHEIFGVTHVPQEAGRLILMLGVGGQNSPSDTIWFDDVNLYRLR